MSPSATGVTIRTWGTTDAQDETGISRFVTDYLYHTVAGHASIELTLPATKENWQMVEKYLKNRGIPYKRERLETKKVLYVNGQPVFSEENAYEEDVIKVYFSWWPSDDKRNFDFHTLAEDLVCERLSAEVKYAPEWEAYLQPEKRHHHWLLSKVISLPSAQMLHKRGATQTEISLLTLYHQCDLLAHEMKAFNILYSKLQSKSRNILLHNDLSETEKVLLARFLPESLSDEDNYIDLPLTSAKLKIYYQQLQQQYQQRSTQVIDLISQFEREAKEKIDNLLQNNPLSPRDFKKARSILISHGIWIESTDNIHDIFNQLKKDESEAKKNLTLIEPLIEKNDAQIAEINSLITLCKPLSEQVSAYIELVSFAADRNTDAKTLQAEKEKLMTALATVLEGDFAEQSITEAFLFLEKLLSELRKAKQESIEQRTQLLETKRDLTKNMLTLGYGKLDKLIEKHITSGQLPDHTVHIGLKQGRKSGFDPEKILQQMAAFAIREEPFRLITFNCSHTVSDILTAGAGYQGWIFKRQAFSGSVITPQVVYNNTLTYSRSLTPGMQLTETETENENSWQNYFASWAVSSVEDALNPEATSMLRIWGALNALGAAATSMTIANTKALLEATKKHEQESNPKKKP